MSSGKRFEKTFSRKKNKDKTNVTHKIEDGQFTPPPLSHSQQPNSPNNLNNKGNEQPTTKTKTHNKKTPSKQGKIETQKGKRKLEIGYEKNEEIKKIEKQSINGEKQGKDEKKVNEECTFPTNRISRIIKSEGFNYRLSQEAIFLINKATEKFLEVFSEDAYDCAVQDKKSFIGYRHTSSAVGKEKRLDFLSDFVPEKVVSEKALGETKPAKTSTSPRGVAS